MPLTWTAPAILPADRPGDRAASPGAGGRGRHRAVRACFCVQCKPTTMRPSTIAGSCVRSLPAGDRSVSRACSWPISILKPSFSSSGGQRCRIATAGRCCTHCMSWRNTKFVPVPGRRPRPMHAGSWRSSTGTRKSHRQLMRILLASGRRSAALAQYEACRQALAAELGAVPCRGDRCAVRADCGRRGAPGAQCSCITRTRDLSRLQSKTRCTFLGARL